LFGAIGGLIAASLFAERSRRRGAPAAATAA
ncbi:MAG: hypothetical protein QOH83_774, partial [Solirubrobacteraceae bacterium]|nr:hypothetical protein [Solirubrobacteraceae bacterium]